jgi:hypothetical protein
VSARWFGVLLCQEAVVVSRVLARRTQLWIFVAPLHSDIGSFEQSARVMGEVRIP